MRSMLGLKAPASGSELRARGYEAGARMGSGQFGYAVLVTKACPSGAPESRTYVAKLGTGPSFHRLLTAVQRKAYDATATVMSEKIS